MTDAPIRRPRLDELETFLLAAKHGSLTEAAAVLKLSKTAVAKRIRSLEALVGQRLLDRGPRGATLTEHGRRLVPEVEELLRESERLFERLSYLRAGADTQRISGLRSLSGSRVVSTETVLRETEHFFAEIFHSIDDGVVVLNASDGRILEANGALARILGRPREDLLGRTPSEFGILPPDDYASIVAEASSIPIERQTIEIRAGTELKHVEFSLGSFVLGGERHLLGIGRDVTDRVRHELAIVKQAAQQQAIADLTLLVLAGDSHAALFANAAAVAAAHLHATLTAVWEAGGNDVELRSVHGVPRRRLTALVGTAESRQPFLEALDAEGEVCVDDLTRDRRFSREGIHSLGDHSIAAVRIGATGGERYGFVVAASTEKASFSPSDVEFVRSIANVLGLAVRSKRSAESDLRHRTLLDNFTALVEASRDPTVLVSLEGRFVYLNAAARSFRHSDPALDPDSDSVFDGLDARAARRLRQVVFPATKRDGAWHGTFTVTRPSGQRRPGQLKTVLVRDPSDGAPRWIAAVFSPAIATRPMQT